jgi:subtilisin family serine protease
MPLAPTNIPAFARAHPTYDGRGVIVAILDAGLDAGVLGAGRTLDVRDFSGEGRVTLTEARLDGDLIRLGARSLKGAGRLRGMQSGGKVWAGTIREYDLGELPAADVNGNGTLGDTLAVVLVRGTDGWSLLADTDGDGSLEAEKAVRDYLVARDSFGWHSGGRPPGSVAVNLTDQGAGKAPSLALVYTVGSHGTHVAGIAAGKDLFGVKGFDGVAPGASLLALKIANDARGGITTSGSMARAMDYAIRFAAARRQPLVMNMSFGVGNEIEGTAAIDAVIDSILGANPAVVMTVSAGNDGPGVSTMGFPASARRTITVGATYPGAFLPPDANGRRADDMIAFFSSRGGELASPDLVAPGVAYSSVPRFNTGDEIKNGTSMASPHVAGLAARLLSGLVAEKRTADAATIKRALMAASRTLPGGAWIDQGAGLPDILAAWDLLKLPAPGAQLSVRAEHGVSASLQTGSSIDTSVTFTLVRPAPGAPERYRLAADAGWLTAPASVTVGDSVMVPVRLRAGLLTAPGVYTGKIEGWGADSTWGPAFRLVNTVVKPYPLPADSTRMRFRIAQGELRRIPIQVDSGRGIRIAVSDPRGAPLLAFLHEPGGMPFRGGAAQSAVDTSRAEFELDGRDVIPGVYELVIMAGPSVEVDAMVDIDPAPVQVAALRKRDSVWIEQKAVGPAAHPPARLTARWLGGERGMATSSRGSVDQRLEFYAPAWARRVSIELTMPREQWPLFTDFGFTLVEADGRQIAASPINYAVARLVAEIPDGPGRQLTTVLSPGFANANADALWTARLTIRLYAATPVDLGELPESPFALRPSPFALPSGFHPLLEITTRLGNRVWHRETGLPEAPGPLMP